VADRVTGRAEQKRARLQPQRRSNVTPQPEFLGRLVRLARPVSLAERGGVSLDLCIVTEPPAR
jgi:hypothetical protein